MIKHILLLTLAISSFQIQAQTDTTRYEEVRSLLGFYEYMLNSIGSEKTSTRDKEVIITESYKKVFRDEDVQIEDDLLDDRKVITNKDVPAYLRDVDFFFREIRFDFSEAEIKKIDQEDGNGYFLIAFESSIQGVTIEGEAYRKTQKRFLEINYNEEADDLKIASVYSTKVSREKELRNWWTNLSFGWRSVFSNLVSFDSISNEVLLKMASVDSLNLEGNSYIQDLEPLAALKELRYLNITNTQIENLEPLRYSMNLKTLIARNSSIQTISTLQYFDKLEYLDLALTRVANIESIASLEKLIYLDLASTYSFSFESVGKLNQLKHINLTDTEFSDFNILTSNKNLESILLAQTKTNSIEGVGQLKKVKTLDISETPATSLTGLSGHPTIQKISFNRTTISDLSPLKDAPQLQKVYADYSGVTEQEATKFMVEKSGSLVITNSEQVMQWWSDLPANWKNVFGELMENKSPTKEDLIQLINRDTLLIPGQNLYDPTPLKKFKRVKHLDVSKNLFTTFEFTEEMIELTYLKAEDLPVKSTEGLVVNINLEQALLRGSLLNDISALRLLKKLNYLDVDNSQVSENEVLGLLRANKNVTIIYQTDMLKSWYDRLSSEWKNALQIETSDSRTLHKLIESEAIKIENQPISFLTPLNAFINLKSVILNNVRVTDLSELYSHEGLTSITCTNGPLQSLEGISKLKSLEKLDINNTAIEDLKELEAMGSIKYLNCAGTSIKNLKGVSELYNLESLDVSNTRVWKLERLYGMQNLKKLVCYNTRLRQHTIDDFKVVFPDCEINFY